MAYTFYALYSKSKGRIYIGFNSDLVARISSHNHPGNKGWTRNFMPWVLLYHESFETKKEALVREKELKSYQGRLFIRRLIDQFLLNNP